MYYNNILEVIGNTPLVRINKLNHNPRVTMLGKLEMFNPGGSSKDRIGVAMILQAMSEGKLKKGGTVVEATGAGNTGIGIAIASCVLGLKSILVIPDKVSREKRNLLKAFGAKIIITPTAVPPEDPRSYYRVADRITLDTPGSFQPNQYSNPVNPLSHYRSSGPEIWDQTNGQITHMVISMGTGGTITGIGKFLKEKNPRVKIIGVDHVGSVLMDYFKKGTIPPAVKAYKTEGFGEDFIPKTTDFSVIDEIYQVDDKECFQMARQLARDEGILAGSSSGAVLLIMQKVAKKLKQGMIVGFFPDTGTNYLSKFYNDDWMSDFGYLDDDTKTITSLLKKKLHLITIAYNSSPEEAIGLMRKYQISQLPVVENRQVVGMISELNLIKHLYGKEKIPITVSEIMDRDVIQLPDTVSQSQLAQALSKKEIVVILDHSGKPFDVLTRIDFLASAA